MCGIVACRADTPATPLLLEALARLEYRGYDSIGIAVPNDSDRLMSLRSIDRVDGLRRLVDDEIHLGATTGIGHTRWATHGEVSVVNAHPHADCTGRIGVVHNGIISNADRLRTELIVRGHTMASDVDSEVIAHLVEEGLATTDLHTAVERAVSRLEGSWAIVVLDTVTRALVAASHHSPLVIGHSAVGDFVASDISAIAPWVSRFHALEDGHVVQLTPTTRWRRHGVPVMAPPNHPCNARSSDLVVGSHDDFMAKEIAEQPEVAARVLDAWVGGAGQSECWESLGLPAFRRIAVLGCGTSLNAGRAIASVLAGLGRVPHHEIVASEAEGAVIEPGTLVLAMSQSGETADVLRALDSIQAAGHPVLALTNNVHSALGRRADAVVACDAGTEIGVAATKTFTAQLLTGVCVGLSALAAQDRIDREVMGQLLVDLKRVPDLLAQAITAARRAVPPVVDGVRDRTGFLFLGRGLGTTYADEGALKLKELSYRWAESFPGGELKHGPLALVEAHTPVIVVDPDERRMAVNVAEVRTRGGHVIGLGGPGSTIPVIGTPGLSTTDRVDWLGPLESVVAMQMLARELALSLGCDVDKPRNLAKSVTVE